MGTHSGVGLTNRLRIKGILSGGGKRVSYPCIDCRREKTKNEREIFQIIKDSLDAGAAGVSIVRNVFQHEKKQLMVKAICNMVHENITVNDALKILE